MFSRVCFVVVVVCVHFLAAVSGQDTFLKLDGSRPLGLFANVLDNCTLAFTVENVFFLRGASIVQNSPTNDLMSTVNADAQSVGFFADQQNKRAVVAVVDSTGTLSFASLTDCNSPFVLLDTWTIKTGLNLTSAVRIGVDEILFSGSDGKAVIISWVEGTSGSQLGIKQALSLPLNAGEDVWCSGLNDDKSLFLGVSQNFFHTGPNPVDGFPARLITQDRSGDFSFSARIATPVELGATCPDPREQIQSFMYLRSCGSISVNNRNIGTFFGMNGLKPFFLMTRPLRSDLLGASFHFRNSSSPPDMLPNVNTLVTTFVRTKPDDSSIFVVLLAPSDATPTQDISVAYLMRVDLTTLNITSSRSFTLSQENGGYAVVSPMLVENSAGHKFVFSLLEGSGSGLLVMDTKGQDGLEDVDSLVMMAQLGPNDCSLTKGQNDCPAGCQACVDISRNPDAFLLSSSC